MTGLFRRTKRRTGVLVAVVAAVAGIAVLSGVETVAGISVLVVSAVVLGLGYVSAALVGLFAGRNPRSIAYLIVAAGGALIVLAALVDDRGTLAIGAMVLLGAGVALYRAGQPPPELETTE